MFMNNLLREIYSQMAKPTTCNSPFSPLFHFCLVSQLFHPSCATAESSWGQQYDGTKQYKCHVLLRHTLLKATWEIQVHARVVLLGKKPQNLRHALSAHETTAMSLVRNKEYFSLLGWLQYFLFLPLSGEWACMLQQKTGNEKKQLNCTGQIYIRAHISLEENLFWINHLRWLLPSRRKTDQPLPSSSNTALESRVLFSVHKWWLPTCA